MPGTGTAEPQIQIQVLPRAQEQSHEQQQYQSEQLDRNKFISPKQAGQEQVSVPTCWLQNFSSEFKSNHGLVNK